MNKLRNIKIGDKVIVGKGGSSDRIAEVGFVSDNQIQVNGIRYNILDGRLVGAEEGEKDRIIPATDKEIKRVRRNERKLELIRKVNNTNWYGLSTKTLNTIIEIVDKELQGNFNKGSVLNLEKKNKQKQKISNEERIRRTIQSQRAIQGYVAIGNIDRNFIVG